MAPEKLRLLLFEECNRNCPGCCNKDWDLKSIPVCTDFTPYRLIMLTGGEPMLHPEIILSAVSAIREQTTAPIYLYTAMVNSVLDDVLSYIDGAVITLHSPADVAPFEHFDKTAHNLFGKSLRLNIFEEAGDVSSSPLWKRKEHMEWIPNCPLPNGEVLMRYGGDSIVV